jgi:RNase H-like domain found in reverse transcriptase
MGEGSSRSLQQDQASKIKDDVMLLFPDFNKPFKIHTDASDVQLGSVIMQDCKPVAFSTVDNSILHSGIIYYWGKRNALHSRDTYRAFVNEKTFCQNDFVS